MGRLDVPYKVSLPVGDLDLHLIQSSLDPHESALRQLNGILIGSAVLPSSPVCPKHTDRHTDHATRDICSNRPHLCIACRRRGLIVSEMMLKMASTLANKIRSQLSPTEIFPLWISDKEEMQCCRIHRFILQNFGYRSNSIVNKYVCSRNTRTEMYVLAALRAAHGEWR